MDPTRRMLRVFGVKVTTYEEKTSQILEQAAAATEPAEMLRLVGEALELTADMNAQLRETTGHVLEAQARALNELKAALEKMQGRT